MFLTREELVSLTGWKRHHKQIEWLAENDESLKEAGVHWFINRRNRPVVMRNDAGIAAIKSLTEPNWDAMPGNSRL